MRFASMSDVQTRAPGRVNLIGEHTDYNDGFVLPCAIACDTRVHGTPRPDRTITARSQFDEPAVFDLERLPEERSGEWTDYVRGIAIELRRASVDLRGADLRITGTMPLGAGLSSSASFEIAVALAMLALAHEQMPVLELARLAQRAEIEHVGTRCGIMDQAAVLLAKKGCALFLDTRSLAFRHVPVPPDVAVVVCNTMVKHDLSAGAYNERRSECERSVELLRKRYPTIGALRDVDLRQLDAACALLPPVLFRRARHVVGENTRVLETVEALQTGNLARVGELLYESHRSLRDDYEVSCPQLDTMVAAAQAFDGTIGARMTGGGFGGCTVNLVRADRAGAFRNHVAAAYERETGIVPQMYDGTPSDGACSSDE